MGRSASNYFASLLRGDGMTDKPKKLNSQKRWRIRNPKAYAAHKAVYSALRNGNLKRQSCECCGDPKAEAHHPDYSRPLKVKWLCRTHHKFEHARKGVQ
jgi:hypothetical protein